MTAPCPASDTAAIRGLRGATWALVEGMREGTSIRNTALPPATLAVMLTADTVFADLFEVTAGGAQLAAAACVAATDSALTFTAGRGEPRRGLLILGGGNPEAARRALSWDAAVPPRGQPLEHARAASGVLQGNCGPGPAANMPPGRGQRRGGS